MKDFDAMTRATIIVAMMTLILLGLSTLTHVLEYLT